MTKPEELQVQNDKEAQEKAKELEKYFDAKLKEKYEGMDKDVIIEVPEGHKNHILQHCLNSYRGNGWTVTYQNDQRDGEYVVFKHSTPRSYSTSGWKD